MRGQQKDDAGALGRSEADAADQPASRDAPAESSFQIRAEPVRSAAPEPAQDPFADDLDFYKLVSAFATDLISVHESDGTFRFVTPNVERLFGHTPQAIVGQSLYSLVHTEDVGELVEQHYAQAGTEERRMRYRLRCGDGGYRWVETRGRAHLTHTDLHALICFTRDIDDEQRTAQAAHEAEARLRQELELLAATDALTQLPNRRATQKALEREVARCARGAEPMTVALLDIDHFKQVNDAFGHEAGDRVLVAVAEVLASRIRECDFVGRWGGEEFLMVLSAADPEAGRRAAQRVCEQVRRLSLGLGRAVTISIGVATHRLDEPVAHLVCRADQALYEAKRSGRDRVSVAE